jgi:hypothetical protein
MSNLKFTIIFVLFQKFILFIFQLLTFNDKRKSARFNHFLVTKFIIFYVNEFYLIKRV